MPLMDDDYPLQIQHQHSQRAGGHGKQHQGRIESTVQQPPSELLKAFRASAERTCEREFWSKNKRLAQLVVGASVTAGELSASTSSPIDDGDRGDFEALAVAALTSARRVVKEATQNRSLDCLCVGVHCLRAVSTSRLMRKVSNQETVIRVLYHCVVTSEQAYHDANKNDKEAQERAISFALLSYDTLGRLLQYGGYSVSSKRGGVRFESPASNDLDDENLDGSMLFCVPVRATETESESCGEITPDLVCTIAVAATQAACRMLLAAARNPSIGARGTSALSALLPLVGSKTGTLLATLSHLAYSVLPSWIFYLEAEACEDGAAATKEVVSNFKRVHNILWEAADIESDPIRSLQLREQSLGSLLCFVSGKYRPSKSVEQLLVGKGHFEVACTMAKKAVAAAEVRRLGQAHAVTSFHATVGRALDSFALTTTVPTAYVDYAAQRAFDGVKEPEGRPYRPCCSTCLFRKCPYIFGHSDCANDTDAAVMSLFFLALAVRGHLTGVDEDCSAFLDESTLILRSFEDVVLVEATSQEMAYRSFHLLWSLKLNVTVFDAVNTMQEHSFVISKMSSLKLAADMLVRCVGPLTRLVLHAAKVKAIPQLGNAILESYSRGIAAYEGLVVKSDAPTKAAAQYPLKSEDAAGALVDALLDVQHLPGMVDTIEKGAKFLSIVARRRHESLSNPLIHLTLSLQLYAALDAGPGPESSNRMSSSRWLWLASIYQSMDRAGEEALSIAVALHYMALEKVLSFESICNNVPVCALQHLCVATRGVLPSAPPPFAAMACEKTKGLISRLISLCASNRLTLDTPVRADFQLSTPSSVSDVLVTMSRGPISVGPGLEGNCGIQIDMNSLLDVVLSSTSCTASTLSTLNVLHVATVLAIMEALGKKLQNTDSHVDDSRINMYDVIVERGPPFLQSIGESEEGRGVLLSVFYVCASVSLVSQHAMFDFDTWNLKRHTLSENRSSPLVAKAIALTGRARRLLEKSAHEAEDMSTLASVLRQLIAAYQFQLETIHGLAKEPFCDEHSITLLGQLADNMNLTTKWSDVRDLSRWGLMSLLSKLCDSAAADGEKIQALQFAIWNLRTAGKVRADATAWLEATAFSLQALDTAFVNDVYPADHTGESNPYNLELRANALRWKLQRTLDQHEMVDIEQELLLLLLKFSSQKAQDESPLLQWAESSAMLGLSEVYNKLRRFEDGIYYAGECFKICRSLSRTEAGAMTQGSATDTLYSIATATLLTRSWLRRVECLRATSQCYWNIGDRFRSSSYAEQALRLVSTNNESSFNHFKLPDFIAFIKSLPFSTSTDMHCRRLLFSIKARSTSWDLLVGQFQNGWCLCTKPVPSASSMVCGVNHELEHVNHLESGRFMQERNQLDALYSQATSRFSDFLGLLRVSDLSLSDRNGIGLVAPMASFKLKLAIARRFLFDPQSAIQEREAVLACESVVEASTDCECRATGLYFLGMIALRKAQRAGDLARLWSGFTNREDDPCGARTDVHSFLGEARQRFMMMLPLLGPTTENLTRDALRSLALTTGPSSEETADLIHTSIGSSLRRLVARKIEKQEVLASRSEGKVVELLKSLDTPFGHAERKGQVRDLFSTIERLMPVEWRVTACALCPSGEMLITSSGFDDLGDLKTMNVCVFPDVEEGMNCTALYDSIMVPLDTIISDNQDQLQNGISDDTQPREWWSHRKNVDSKLQELLSAVEKACFDSDTVRLALVGDERKGASHALQVNLASKFEAVSDVTSPQKDIFDSVGSGACTLLVLDENLQRFPFESMPIFEGVTVCRQPSLPFLATKLWEMSSDDVDLEFQPALVDLQRVRFVLDPESDLPATTKRLQPFLDSVEAEYNASWERVIRKAPSKAFIEESLTVPEGLYLYFGHGNGQPYFSKSDVEGLLGATDGDAAERRVRASIVLMGCSSGRLESVNRKNTKLLDRQLPLFHEPEGLALCYAGAGAPCVVGNLWDVTDRDIDTFAMAMLERFVAEDSSCSLAECVALSRSACKLRYGTGGAPVCYGVPVFRKYP